MADQRDAILAGTKAAHSLHRDLGIRDLIERQNGARVDVFGAIGKLGATLMFQPLDTVVFRSRGGWISGLCWPTF